MHTCTHLDLVDLVRQGGRLLGKKSKHTLAVSPRVLAVASGVLMLVFLAAKRDQTGNAQVCIVTT